MHLIAALSAGIRGAKNGSASFFVRGTTTPAAVYEDSAGKVRAYEAVTLDSRGSANAYVDSVVDVVVYDSNGSEVRAWTDGRSSDAVVVDHAAFSSEQSLTGALATLKTSAGTTDWNVLLDGEEQSMYAAIYGSGGVFYSAAQYGAVGDGAGDDWAPIQGAINAARQAGGGTVFLAAGTYKTTSALDLPTGVSLVGASPNSTIIKLSGNDTVLVVGGSSGIQLVHGITLARYSASDLPLLSNVAVDSIIENVFFDGTNCSGALFTMDAGGRSRITYCVFNLSDGSGAINTYTSSGGRVQASACVFKTAENYSSPDTGIVGIYDVHLDGCWFDCDGTTSGSIDCMLLGGNVFGSMDGCQAIVANTTPSFTIMNIGNLNNSGGKEFVFEDCTLWDGTKTQTLLYEMAESSSGYYARLCTARHRHSAVTQVTTAINSGNVHYLASDASQYGVWSLYNTNATAGALSSGACFGASSSTSYSANVEQGREAVVIYALKTAEDFLLSTPNENRMRNSAAPGWKSLAGSAHVMKFVMCRAYAQSPSVGDLTRWHCTGQSSGQPTVDTANREGYTF